LEALIYENFNGANASAIVKCGGIIVLFLKINFGVGYVLGALMGL